MTKDASTSRPPFLQSTSLGLLARAKVGDSDAWQRMVRLYFPLVYGWCERKGLSPEDCLDVAQEIFTAVSLHVPRFEKTSPGSSFRGWLRTITENKITDHWRRQRRRSQSVGGSQAHEILMELEDSTDDSEDETQEEGDKVILFRAAADIIRNEFEPRTWDAFWRVTADSSPVDVVADQLGMSKNAVYLAKSRVLRRLRELLQESFEEL